MSREPTTDPRTSAAPPGAAVVVAEPEVERLGPLLDRVLSALALLALRTRTARWSIVAPELWALRDALDDHHARLDAHVDAIAGRMGELGAFPGGASDAWHELAASGELALDGTSSAADAIEDVVADGDRVTKLLAAAIARLAGDEETAALLGRTEQDVVRMRWSLRSLADALLSPAAITLEQVA